MRQSHQLPVQALARPLTPPRWGRYRQVVLKLDLKQAPPSALAVLWLSHYLPQLDKYSDCTLQPDVYPESGLRPQRTQRLELCLAVPWDASLFAPLAQAPPLVLQLIPLSLQLLLECRSQPRCLMYLSRLWEFQVPCRSDGGAHVSSAH